MKKKQQIIMYKMQFIHVLRAKSYIKTANIRTKILVLQHIDIPEMCCTTKITVMIFSVLDVWFCRQHVYILLFYINHFNIEFFWNTVLFVCTSSAQRCGLWDDVEYVAWRTMGTMLLFLVLCLLDSEHHIFNRWRAWQWVSEGIWSAHE